MYYSNEFKALNAFFSCLFILSSEMFDFLVQIDYNVSTKHRKDACYIYSLSIYD